VDRGLSDDLFVIRIPGEANIVAHTSSRDRSGRGPSGRWLCQGEPGGGSHNRSSANPANRSFRPAARL